MMIIKNALFLIHKHLTTSDVVQVKSSVQYYNTLPLKTRQFHGTLTLSAKSLYIPAACGYNLYVAGVSWSGAVTVHLSYCLVLEASLGIGIDAGIPAALAAIFPPALAIAAVVGVYLLADSAALATYASECDDGAYFNFMLWNPAIFWASKDC